MREYEVDECCHFEPYSVLDGNLSRCVLYAHEKIDYEKFGLQNCCHRIVGQVESLDDISLERDTITTEFHK